MTGQWRSAAEIAFGHLAAVLAGAALLILSMWLGVEVVMVPAAMALGVVGAGLFLGGLWVRVSKQG